MLALLTVFKGWVFLEMRKLIPVLREPLPKLWKYWELRVLVLVSLSLQLCLLHFGSRRRYSVKTWLRVFFWLSYLSADSVATFALGVISNNLGNCNDSQLQNELLAFWAPFLLLHLGGQDTVTAYAMQDNELWLRHLLGLVVQSGVVLYIFLLSWKVSWLSFLTIPMFLVGFIKYAERTWVLKSAVYEPINTDLVRSSILNPPLTVEGWMSITLSVQPTSPRIKWVAFQFFEKFRCLFLNLKGDGFDRDLDYRYFCHHPTAWQTIEDELGYAYDVYYTKAPFFFTAWGFLFRLLSFTSILFVFVLFHIKERHKHPQIDLIITYLLLVGAVLIEIYAVILLCASDWPLCDPDPDCTPYRYEWLIKHFNHIRNGFAKLTSKQRWSNSMGQLDLLGFCLKVKSLQDGHGTPKLFASLREWANRELEMHFYRTNKQVSDWLKGSVFKTIQDKLLSDGDVFSDEYDKYIGQGTLNVEAYQSIIIWHIATDLCFYTDSVTNVLDKKWKEMSKDVSDYMMYILAMCPLAFSTGSAKYGFVSACRTLENYISERGLSRLPKDEVCKKMISGYGGDIDDLQDRDPLRLAIQLAGRLNRMDGKWKMLSKFWVENLAYVAILCQGNYHAQLLRKGGEFLTHVWLLVEQFNLKESFQKSLTRPTKE